MLLEGIREDGGNEEADGTLVPLGSTPLLS